jgi:signal transduction histidine kinase
VVTTRRDAINRFLTVAMLLALVGLVVLLAGVERSYRAELDETVQAAVRQFALSEVLKTPHDLGVSIDAVEGVAHSLEGSSRIQALYVAKRIKTPARDALVLVYPYSYSAEHPDWQTEFAAKRAESVLQDREAVGTVYFDLNTTTLTWVRLSLALTALIAVLAAAALLARIFRQERTLTATVEVLRQNQRELIRLERLSIAGLLTANIFHDIRKPITNLKHELTDLAEALGGFAGATRALRNMNDQVTLFFDILRDLNLERFVRADEADEEYVDLNRVIEQSLRLVQYERGATRLSVTLAPGLPLVLAHPYRLVQVLSNIVLNGYQAMEGRGELRVTTRGVASADGLAPRPGPRAAGGSGKGSSASSSSLSTSTLSSASSSPGSLSTSAAAGSGEAPRAVEVEIADSGPGISAENLEKIFAPFFTTKSPDKGTGLGLYISRSIVEQLGGRLEVTSCPGEGTTFTLRLPACD